MRGFSCGAHRRFTRPPHLSPHVGPLHSDEHENRLTEGGPGGGGRARTGELGNVRPRTAALLVAGFAIGALTIGAMSLTLSPADPPAVDPIEVGSPDEHDRSGDRDPGRDSLDSPRRAERRARLARQQRRARRGGKPAPPVPQVEQQSPGPATPPAPAAPRPSPPPAGPSPPATRGEPQPRSPPQTLPQPQPLPPPPADDDDAGEGHDLGVDD